MNATSSRYKDHGVLLVSVCTGRKEHYPLIPPDEATAKNTHKTNGYTDVTEKSTLPYNSTSLYHR